MDTKKRRGGSREGAGRPPSSFVSVKLIGLRRCRKCGRFASYKNEHNCPERKCADAQTTA